MSRAALATGSATNRSLRQGIATQHSVGHEETACLRACRCETPSPHRASRSATVATITVVSGCDAVAAEANIRGKRRGYLTLAVVRH